MALSPDSRRLAACYFPTFVTIWNLTSEEVVGERVTVSRVNQLAWSADGLQIATGAEVAGPTFRIIDTMTTTPSPRDLPREAGPTTAAFVAGTDLVVTGTKAGKAYVFGGSSEPVLVFAEHSTSLVTLAVDGGNDGQRVLSSDEGGTVFVWPLTPSPVAKARLARAVDDWEQEKIDGSVSDG